MSDLFVFERVPKSRMHHETCSVSHTASGKFFLSPSFFFSSKSFEIVHTVHLLKGPCFTITVNGSHLLTIRGSFFVSFLVTFAGLNWMQSRACSYLQHWCYLLPTSMFLKMAHLANLAGLQDCPANHQGWTKPSGSSILSSLAVPLPFATSLIYFLFAINRSIASYLPTI